MTLRQGLEKLRRSGYTAIPVIDSEDRYVGVISEGDFLWNILAHNQELDEITLKSLEQLSVRDMLRHGKVQPVCISTDMEAIDDRSVFIGIITRSDIIKYFASVWP